MHAGELIASSAVSNVPPDERHKSRRRSQPRKFLSARFGVLVHRDEDGQAGIKANCSALPTVPDDIPDPRTCHVTGSKAGTSNLGALILLMEGVHAEIRAHTSSEWYQGTCPLSTFCNLLEGKHLECASHHWNGWRIKYGARARVRSSTLFPPHNRCVSISCC